MYKYTETKSGIARDGHTMFNQDIVRDLNRNSYLEGLAISQREEIESLKSQCHQLKSQTELARKTFKKIKVDGYCSVQMARSYLQFTPKQCLEIVKADAVISFCETGVSPNAKAGCIGDFSLTTVQTCPECWQEQNDECELCDGETDENGSGELEVVIPWTTQKEIFIRMLSFKLDHYENKPLDR